MNIILLRKDKIILQMNIILLRKDQDNFVT